jgi:hypothetical protein
VLDSFVMSLSTTIVLSPPPTVIDDTHKHYDVATAVLVLMIIATSFTVARFYLRWKSHTFGWDDWAMVPAVVSIAVFKAKCSVR